MSPSMPKASSFRGPTYGAECLRCSRLPVRRRYGAALPVLCLKRRLTARSRRGVDSSRRAARARAVRLPPRRPPELRRRPGVTGFPPLRMRVCYGPLLRLRAFDVSEGCSAGRVIAVCNNGLCQRLVGVVVCLAEDGRFDCWLR